MAVIAISTLRFAVVGSDRRLAWVAQALSEQGYAVRLCGSSHTDFAERYPSGALDDALAWCGAVVLPMPLASPNTPVRLSGDLSPTLSRLLSLAPRGSLVFGGYLSPAVHELCRRLGLRAYDYASLEGFAERNAVPTAEGAAKLLIEHTDGTIMHAHIAVLGYGRTGKATAELLKSMDACVTVVARSPLARAVAQTRGLRTCHLDELAALAPSLDAVVNTIPTPVIGEDVLTRLDPSCPIVELASAPGGVERTLADKHGTRVIPAPALPAQVAPKAAGRIVADSILSILKEELL